MHSKHTSNILHNRNNLIVLVTAAVIWFSLLGYRDLIEPDEGRYAEIPREMVASGDWLTPRLNGFKYFEKPAFQYWMTAISYELFGISNATARLWVSLFGFGCGLFIWYLGSRLFNPDAGFYAFVITISSLMFVVMGHLLTLDMTVSVFLVVGIGALALAQTRRDRPAELRNWMLVGWAALAGAVLSKGLIGVVLPGGAVVIYSLWQRDWALWKYLHLGKGMVLFLTLTAPWFVAVSLANDEFARFFFIHEHLERYTTSDHRRDGPVFYFLLVFILGTMPWLVSSLNALVKPDFNWRPGADAGFNTERFLWVFVVTTFIFFSLGKSKLPAYILPIMPIVALLAGRKLSTKSGSGFKGDAWALVVLIGIFFLLAGFATRFATETIPAEIYQRLRWWVVAGALVLCAGAFCLFIAHRNPRRYLVIGGLCAMLGFQVFNWGMQELSPSRSSREVADAIIASQLRDSPVYSVGGGYPPSLPFYLGKPITLVEFKGELAMGIDAEPEKWLGSWEQFVERWQAESQAVAIIKPDAFERYRTLGLPMRKIYQGPRRTVVARR